MAKEDEDRIKRNIRVNSLIQGLTTPDPEYKQYILEELLKDECTEVEFSDIKARERWAAPQHKKL